MATLQLALVLLDGYPVVPSELATSPAYVVQHSCEGLVCSHNLAGRGRLVVSSTSEGYGRSTLKIQ